MTDSPGEVDRALPVDVLQPARRYWWYSVQLEVPVILVLQPARRYWWYSVQLEVPVILVLQPARRYWWYYRYLVKATDVVLPADGTTCRWYYLPMVTAKKPPKMEGPK
jgi:hypothetical protein